MVLKTEAKLPNLILKMNNNIAHRAITVKSRRFDGNSPSSSRGIKSSQGRLVWADAQKRMTREMREQAYISNRKRKHAKVNSHWSAGSDVTGDRRVTQLRAGWRMTLD